jgi:hypothetical protein
LPEKQIRELKKDPSRRLSGNFRIHKLEKMFAGGERNKKYAARPCIVFAARKKRSKTRNIRKFCVVLLHKGSCFEKYYLVTNY